MDSLNIGFILCDLDDNVLDVNEAYLKMTGWKREEIVGHNVSEGYSKTEYRKLRAMDLSLRAQGDFNYEFYMYSKERERIPILINISTNVDEDGKPESQNVLITDIREQKKVQSELKTLNETLITSRDNLEKEKKTMEAILFGIGDCVTIFGKDGNLLLSNPQGKEIRGERQVPLMSLEAGNKGKLTLSVNGEKRHFLGQMEVIQDSKGDAYAYAEILKDITDQKRLAEREQELFQIKRAIERREIETEMIGISRVMQKVFDLILRCAEVDSTVAISGETGVGKELAARAIHKQSTRKDKPFVAVNCSAIPETLLESELFGHMRGAFTGAVSERLGLFREAHGGTLFLDEVGDLSGALQGKLLRALQEMEVRPIGGSRTYPVDLRVITASNRDLKELVSQGRFRADLYYRIAVIPLFLPPLRERKEDILPLCEHFIKKHTEGQSEQLPRLDRDVQRVLLDYTWPGNIRELENSIEHAIAMARGPSISPQDLPVHFVLQPEQSMIETSPVTDSSLRTENKPLLDLRNTPNSAKKIWEVEKQAISDALNLHNGNQTLAAKELGICRSTLWRKLKKYDLQIVRHTG